VGDEPAPVCDGLPVLASALGAKSPRRLPRWLGQLVAGEAATVMMTEARGASNTKAKRARLAVALSELAAGLRQGPWLSDVGGAASGVSCETLAVVRPGLRRSPAMSGSSQCDAVCELGQAVWDRG
jgi:hypothetical protein